MSFRKTVFWLHLLTGVAAGIVIFIMSVTGVLLMYQKQITDWADDNRVTRREEGANRLPVQTLAARLQEVETNRPSAITVYSDPERGTAFAFGRAKVVYADPYTGTIIGGSCATVRAFFQSMIEWHRWLGMQGENRPIGKAITGACNLGFLFLVMSGFYLWWPRSWNWRSVRAVTLFGRGLSGKARDFNWHNVIGFWSAIPLFILVFTATFFSYSWTTGLLYKATGEAQPAGRAGPPPGRGSGESGEAREQSAPDHPFAWAGSEALWAIAEEQVQGWKSISLRVGEEPGAPMVFTVDRGNGARPDLRGTLTLDSRTGLVQKWETFADQGSGRQIRSWIRWTHTGEAGGFLGQTVAGVASGGGAVLVWTGFALTWRRFRARKGVRL